MEARATDITTRLLANNRGHAERRRGPAGDGRPSLRIAVLACMDARLNPYAILGLTEGEAHIIRNAGGVATDDAIRSLAISQQLLGTEEVVVIAHTDCGMTKFSDEELARRLERECGERPGWSALAFADLDASVRESIRRIEESPFLRQRSARGFVYEVESGRLREVNSS